MLFQHFVDRIVFAVFILVAEATMNEDHRFVFWQNPSASGQAISGCRGGFYRGVYSGIHWRAGIF